MMMNNDVKIVDTEAVGIRLKTCLFCGGKAIMIDASALGTHPYFYVTCCNNSCPIHIETDGFETAQEAAAVWNKRAGSGE